MHFERQAIQFKILENSFHNPNYSKTRIEVNGHRPNWTDGEHAENDRGHFEVKRGQLPCKILDFLCVENQAILGAQIRFR